MQVGDGPALQRFPEGFLWGAATAAHQVEGGNVNPTITPHQLRGLVLCCGPYDLGLARQPGTEAGRRFIQIVLWA